MKTILFVRHAKSSWDNPGLSDMERPLNQRGIRDAPFMASLLRGKGYKPDALISSPAVRAHTTARYFARKFEISEEEILIHNELYHASPQEILQVVKNQNDVYNTLFIFGHNPGFTSIANYFSTEYFANVPTCGIVEVKSEIEHWSELNPDNSRANSFYFPKQYFT